VFILDDDRRIRSLLRSIVEEEGPEPICEKRSEGALEELEKGSFGLIFLDLVLPGLG
jgi:DNA-binding response OmpR family regulator